MASSTREVRRRVKAVKNIRQITRAMELVSAAKMQKAVTAVQQSRRYAELAWDTLRAVTTELHAAHHPLLAARPRRRLLLVLMTSNRGLAGGYNAKVMEAAKNYLEHERTISPDLEIETVSIGKKGRDYLHKMGYKIAADFLITDKGRVTEEIRPLSQLIFEDYKTEKYDAVVVAYTDFVSLLRQEPRVKELLPLTQASEVLVAEEFEGESKKSSHEDSEYIFEPNAAEVLEHLIPRLLEVQLYQVAVESRASEQAARMMAMRNATDAAGDLIDDLTLAYNQLRQSGITSELAEISAGRLALGA